MDLLARTPITSSNYGPVVSIVSWSLVAAVIFCAVLKWVIAYMYVGLQWDDGFILGAVVFNIAQTVATSIQVPSGVGQHFDALTASQIQILQKAGYASQLFFVLVLAFAKLSTVTMILVISPRTHDRRAALAIGGLVVVWSLASLFAVAFQCGATDAWQILGNQCVDQVAFWTAYSVVNIVTEIALIVLPCAVVMTSNATWETKWVTVAIFHTRLVTVGAIIVQIVLTRLKGHGSDPTYDSWPPILCLSVVQSIAVITVCIPYIKGMVIGMESGMLRTGHGYRRKQSDTSS